MKRLQNLGTLLNKSEQRGIVGGYGATIYCKTSDPEEDPCEVPVLHCDHDWLFICEQFCQIELNSASCGYD